MKCEVHGVEMEWVGTLASGGMRCRCCEAPDYEEPAIRRTGKTTKALKSLYEWALKHPSTSCIYVALNARHVEHCMDLLTDVIIKPENMSIIGHGFIRLSNESRIYIASKSLFNSGWSLGMKIHNLVHDHAII